MGYILWSIILSIISINISYLVVALPGGEWDVRKPLDDGRKPELIRFLIMSLEIFEETLKMIYKYGYPNQTPMIITKFTVIFDLKHFTYAKFAHKRCELYVRTYVDIGRNV